jgi:hypothetical protein
MHLRELTPALLRRAHGHTAPQVKQKEQQVADAMRAEDFEKV